MSFFKKLLGSGDKTPQAAPAPQPKPAPAPQPTAEEKPKLVINRSDVFTGQSASNKAEALAFIADNMLANGYVSADYTEALLGREDQVSTYLTNGVAIPHGVVDAKHLVSKTGLIIVQYPNGVTWNDGETVNLAVGIAANGDEHLAVLAQLTKVVMDAELAKKLGTTATADDIIKALGMEVKEDAAAGSADDYDIKAEVTIVDKAGMHARPATVLSKMAGKYADTDVKISCKGKAVSAKSMMKLLTLGISCGDKVVISAEGGNAQAAVDEISSALAAGLDEPASGVNVPDGATSFDVKVVDKAGIHARPATLLAKKAAEYKGTDIQISSNGKSVDMKSMMKIMTLGVSCGDSVNISASGDDAAAAVKTLATMLGEGLDEDNKKEENNNAEYNPLEGLSALSNPVGKHSFTGAAASPGIAAANVFVFKEEELHLEETATDLSQEIIELDNALVTANEQLEALYVNMMKKSPSEAEIFKAHQQLIADESIVDTAKDIINEGHKAAWSWDRALKDQIAALEAIDDERIKARTADMRDVAVRVARILTNKGEEFSFPKDEDFILLATELTPSQTAHLSDVQIKAIVTELGGPNSHMAILARALGIPAIVGAGPGLIDTVETGEMSIVDPQSSTFIVSPDEATLEQAKKLISDWEGIQNIENAQKFEEAITTDGHKVDVVCNIAKPSDAQGVLDNGGEGVGLLRSEFLFEAAPSEPSIDEQFESLRQIAETLGDRTLIVRTSDIGGDKPVSWLNMPKEDNPFLGVRGIRLSFRNEDVFRNQLAAIYKTAIWQQGQGVKSGIHIMFPMISKLSEWQKARAIADEVREHLGAPSLPLGIMIEVPSAALIADHFAKEVDFFSIGSNDMTQYTLAMDRLHPQLAAEADSYTPALLRLIKMTTKAAEENGKWVGVCGNMAADPDMAAILVGLGVKELSVSPANVPAVKFLIRSVSYAKLKEKAEKALALGHSSDVHRLYENRDDLM